jgi:hypothetical protein
MRLKPEAMDAALRRIAERSSRSAEIRAAFKAVAPELPANLNPELYAQSDSQKCWEVAILRTIYGDDSITL